LFVCWWLESRGRRRWALGLAAAPVAIVVVYYALLNPAGRLGLLGLGTTAWYAAACVMMIRTAAEPSARGATAIPDSGEAGTVGAGRRSAA
jgi:hypothetical protein